MPFATRLERLSSQLSVFPKFEAKTPKAEADREAGVDQGSAKGRKVKPLRRRDRSDVAKWAVLPCMRLKCRARRERGRGGGRREEMLDGDATEEGEEEEEVIEGGEETGVGFVLSMEALESGVVEVFSEGEGEGEGEGEEQGNKTSVPAPERESVGEVKGEMKRGEVEVDSRACADICVCAGDCPVTTGICGCVTATPIPKRDCLAGFIGPKTFNPVPRGLFSIVPDAGIVGTVKEPKGAKGATIGGDVPDLTEAKDVVDELEDNEGIVCEVPCLSRLLVVGATFPIVLLGDTLAVRAAIAPPVVGMRLSLVRGIAFLSCSRIHRSNAAT